MSAFDRLVEIFESGLDPELTVGESVQSVLDEHARELANKIRKADRDVSFSDAYYVGTGMADAADLIDPDKAHR